MRLPRHASSFAALIFACTLIISFANAADTPPVVSLSAASAERTQPTAGQTVSAAASGVVTFADLIAQDLRQPRVAPPERRRSSEPDRSSARSRRTA
jgi:hypothetical protein